MSYDCSPTGCHTPTPHHPHFYIIVGMVHGHEYVEQPSFAGRVAIPQTWAGGKGEWSTVQKFCVRKRTFVCSIDQGQIRPMPMGHTHVTHAYPYGPVID